MRRLLFAVGFPVVALVGGLSALCVILAGVTCYVAGGPYWVFTASWRLQILGEDLLGLTVDRLLEPTPAKRVFLWFVAGYASWCERGCI